MQLENYKTFKTRKCSFQPVVHNKAVRKLEDLVLVTLLFHPRVRRKLGNTHHNACSTGLT